jgi:hypothetical protein
MVAEPLAARANRIERMPKLVLYDRLKPGFEIGTSKKSLNRKWTSGLPSNQKELYNNQSRCRTQDHQFENKTMFLKAKGDNFSKLEKGFTPPSKNRRTGGSSATTAIFVSS